MSRNKHLRRILSPLCAFAIITCSAPGAPVPALAAEQSDVSVEQEYTSALQADASALQTDASSMQADIFPQEEVFSFTIDRIESTLNSLYALLLQGGPEPKTLHLEIEPATLRLLNVASEAVIKADASWIKSLFVDLIPGETEWTFMPEDSEYNYEPATILAQGMIGRLSLNGEPIVETGISMNDRGFVLAIPGLVSGGYSSYMDQRTALAVNDAIRAFIHRADLLPSAETVAKVLETLGLFAQDFHLEGVEEGPAKGYYDNIYSTVRYYKGTVSSKKLLETLTYVVNLLEGDEALKGQINHIFESLKEYPYLNSMIDADDLLRDLAYYQANPAGETGIDPEQTMQETEDEWTYEEYEYETEEDFTDEAGDLILGAIKDETLGLVRDSESMLEDYPIECALLYDLQGQLVGFTVGGNIYTGDGSLLDIRWIVDENLKESDECTFTINSMGRLLVFLSGYKDPETGEYWFGIPFENLLDGQLDSLYYQRYSPSACSFGTTGIKLGADGTLTGTIVIDTIPGFKLPKGMSLEICFDKGTVSLVDDTAVYMTLSMAEGEEIDTKGIKQTLMETNRQRYFYGFNGDWNFLALANRLLDAGMPQDFFKEFPISIKDLW